MRKSTPILFAVTVLLMVSLACGVPSVPVPVTGPTMDVNAIGTAILQTAVAAATQTGAAFVPVDIVSSPVSTFTPTLSPTAAFSPTPILTGTASVPMVSVSKDTNCRLGPGQAYERVGALMVGEEAVVLALDPTGRYWYIENPDQPGKYCWVWTEFAMLSGSISTLPIYTPPPTPTPVPDFEVTYASTESCSAWWINLQITNNSSLTFKSVAITIKDQNTNDSLSSYADQFKEVEGCHTSATKDVLNPGERFIVSAPAFAYPPKGHKLRATVTLCTAAGQKGTCVTKTIKINL